MTRSKVWTLLCFRPYKLWWPLQPGQGPHSCVLESVETLGKKGGCLCPMKIQGHSHTRHTAPPPTVAVFVSWLEGSLEPDEKVLSEHN